jgi:hypothetical protein
MPKTGNLLSVSCGQNNLSEVEESRVPAAHVEERPFMAA